ncbi:hypothetical protein B0H17DRAFT_1336725 [Mycena rosella]|uniref:Uncharacterized protein n=1 Tax=Mycena rosella TaxID=1033263 RepID=A0AAD7G6G9_MYCRO|nr:hypothetical protein B0H17DRAFT_1336725 [Mycena rosella]
MAVLKVVLATYFQYSLLVGFLVLVTDQLEARPGAPFASGTHTGILLRHTTYPSTYELGVPDPALLQAWTADSFRSGSRNSQWAPECTHSDQNQNQYYLKGYRGGHAGFTALDLTNRSPGNPAASTGGRPLAAPLDASPPGGRGVPPASQTDRL